jgi:hypothetical protein
MTCRHTRALLSDHRESLLPGHAAQKLTAHLAECADCRRVREEMTAAGAALRDLAAPLPSRDLRSQALTAWSLEEVRGSRQRDVGGGEAPASWRLALGLVVVVSLVLSWSQLSQRERLLPGSAGTSPDQGLNPLATRTNPAEAGSRRGAGMAPSAGQPEAGGVVMRRQGVQQAQRALGALGRTAVYPSFFYEAPRAVGSGAGGEGRGASPAGLHVDNFHAVGSSPLFASMRGKTPPDAPVWTAATPDEWAVLEQRVRRTMPVGDDFVQVPFPRLAAADERQIATALQNYRREAAVVDARLAREVTVRQKAIALSDLCERLRNETGIHLAAGPSVADEKVTLFCQKQPLRDVMRQLSRPFGYTWLRSGSSSPSGAKASGGTPPPHLPPDEWAALEERLRRTIPGREAGGRGYRYELVQDLKSQLLEEELRNRDRNEALVALDAEIERYRPYLGLSPDEALARLKGAAPAERKALEQLSGLGWGPLQLYYRLSPQDQSALRAGQELRFSAEPDQRFPRPLPSNVARGVLESLRDARIMRLADGSFGVTTDRENLDARPPAAVPEARALVTLKIRQSELGQFTLAGESGFFARSKPDGGGGTGKSGDDGPLAVGSSPTVRRPDNETANASLARDPALRAHISIQPQSSRGGVRREASGVGKYEPAGPTPHASRRPASRAPSPDSSDKVTTADVLEALHEATGMPIAADYYTRLYPVPSVTERNQPLFDALNRLSDTMRLRWRRDGGWLQFRSTTFYDDRLKEVPNRLLQRWAAARRQAGMLALDELVEIARLPDAQLDGADMAEGAKQLFGLEEWELPRNWALRRHLRYLGELTPEQRQAAAGPAGLPFGHMSLAQQQRFLAIALEWDEKPLQSLDELEGAVLRVDYSQLGAFEWRVPGAGADWLQWMMPTGSGRRAPRPPVRAPTRAEALQAARRLDPQLAQGMLQVARRLQPQLTAADMRPHEAQIVPTELNLTFLYVPGASHARQIRRFSFDNQSAYGTW